MTVSEIIKSARIALDMTQHDLGEALGYPAGSAQVIVSRWESGTRPVPMDKIKPLAELLHISPVELLP